MAHSTEKAGQAGGLQSLELALRVLLAMMAQKGPMSLSDLARDLDMSPSKVHRYLASFLNTGFVVQAGRSGKYDLGPNAVALGLSAIARHDFVNRAADVIPDLCVETGMTVLLSVWGSEGATVIRWERGESPAVTSMGLGQTLPLLNSATGRAFLAWAPAATTARILDVELRRAKRRPALTPDFQPTQKGLELLTADIRSKGYATVDGRFIPGLVAIAAPVLDWQQEAQAVISLIGTDPNAFEPEGLPVTRLVACAKSVSFADGSPS